MQHATDIAAIADMLDAQSRAWSSGDLHAYMQSYWNDAALYYASSGTCVRGWQPLLDSYRQRYGEGAALGTVMFSEVEIRVLAAAVAMVHGRFQVSVGGAVTACGSYMLVLRKFPEQGWRIIADQVSPETLA